MGALPSAFNDLLLKFSISNLSRHLNLLFQDQQNEQLKNLKKKKVNNRKVTGQNQNSL